jgi:hypothetical protein
MFRILSRTHTFKALAVQISIASFAAAQGKNKEEKIKTKLKQEASFKSHTGRNYLIVNAQLGKCVEKQSLF